MDDHAAALTPAQLRALHAGFYRLGYTKRSHRPERLAAAAAALGLEQPLSSFNELEPGQAGYLIRVLRRSEAVIATQAGGELPGSKPPSRQEPVRALVASTPGNATLPPRSRSFVAVAWCSLALAVIVSNSAADPAGVALALGLLTAIADRLHGPGAGTAGNSPLPDLRLAPRRSVKPGLVT